MPGPDGVSGLDILDLERAWGKYPGWFDELDPWHQDDILAWRVAILEADTGPDLPYGLTSLSMSPTAFAQILRRRQGHRPDGALAAGEIRLTPQQFYERAQGGMR